MDREPSIETNPQFNSNLKAGPVPAPVFKPASSTAWVKPVFTILILLVIGVGVYIFIEAKKSSPASVKPVPNNNPAATNTAAGTNTKFEDDSLLSFTSPDSEAEKQYSIGFKYAAKLEFPHIVS